MDILIMVGQLILGLSILVGLHEFGHLITAKMFGMKVEQYSIGFPPKIWGFTWRGTEYLLGAIPLGGYVKIAGMIDESMDKSFLNQEPQPWEFRSKPAWQRLIVMMGGILVNVITGIIIFILLIFNTGEEYIPAKAIKHGIVAHPLAQEIGLKTGDKILKINGQPFDRFEDVVSAKILLNSNSYYTIERDGQQMDIRIPNDLIEKLSDKKNTNKRFIDPILPFEVGEISPNSPAQKAGMLKGDKIVGINDKSIAFFHELQEALQQNKNKDIDLKVSRKGEVVSLKAKVSEEGKLGFLPRYDFKFESLHYSFGQSVGKGTTMAFTVVYDNIKGFGKIFRGEVSASKSLSGPIGIAQVFGSTWDWQRFWRITAVLSMVLAFMNFLPIPALDGGHVMFLTYEIVSGRKPSDSFLEASQKVGMVLLLGLMAFAIFNDIYKLF